MEALSKFLKAKRKENNMTQIDLAMLSGLGLRFIRECEQGKETLRLDKVRELIGFFGYDFDFVIKDNVHYE